jgi:hypothetical protein
LLWDPFAPWPARRRWIWAGLALLAALVQGPTFVRGLRPDPRAGVDFFQEWASARNVLDGRPAYEPLPEAVRRHVGAASGRPDPEAIRYNAHPPPSVLMALPFAFLSYPDATLAWNLLTLALIGASGVATLRALGVAPTAGAIAPTVALLLLFSPFRQQMAQGQLNGLLLALLTGAWLADRHRRPVLAGVLIGTATAAKLFPGFVLGYFLLRRQGRAVAAGVLAFAAWTVLSAAVLGPGAYTTYRHEVVPHVAGAFRSNWLNASLPGLWAKLFGRDGASFFDNVVAPLWPAPGVATAGTVLSVLAVLGLWAGVVHRARDRDAGDHAFGLTLVAMLLVSPIAWDHYVVLLALPLLHVWITLPPHAGARVAFLVVLVGLGVEPRMVFARAVPPWEGTSWRIQSPLALATALCYLNYLLIATFAMTWRARGGPPAHQPSVPGVPLKGPTSSGVIQPP